LITLVCVLSIFAASPAFAGLLISNGNYKASLQPGESFSHTVKLKIDLTDNPMNFSVAVYGVRQGQDGYIQINADGEDNYIYSAKPFINVSPSNFHLEPGGSQDIIITGTVPTDIKGGGRYAMVYAESNSTGSGKIAVKLAAQLPVTITVLGKETNNSGEITDFSFEKPYSVKNKNISFIFTNTGNYHYKVKVDSLLKDKAGTTLANTTKPLSFYPVMPLFSMIFMTSLVPQDKLVPGAYYVEVKVRQEDGTVLASKEVKFKVP